MHACVCAETRVQPWVSFLTVHQCFVCWLVYPPSSLFICVGGGGRETERQTGLSLAWSLNYPSAFTCPGLRSQRLSTMPRLFGFVFNLLSSDWLQVVRLVRQVLIFLSPTLWFYCFWFTTSSIIFSLTRHPFIKNVDVIDEAVRLKQEDCKLQTSQQYVMSLSKQITRYFRVVCSGLSIFCLIIFEPEISTFLDSLSFSR